VQRNNVLSRFASRHQVDQSTVAHTQDTRVTPGARSARIAVLALLRVDLRRNLEGTHVRAGLAMLAALAVKLRLSGTTYKVCI
jgi:hypothetical protein